MQLEHDNKYYIINTLNRVLQGPSFGEQVLSTWIAPFLQGSVFFIGG